MKPNRSWIVLDSDPALRKKCEDIVLPIKKDDQELIDKMINYVDSCYSNEGLDIYQGIALAGPQVGLMKRVIYVHFDEHDKENKFLLGNPKIVAESVGKSYLSGGEGCLSVEKYHEGFVMRSKKIVVEGIDLLTDEKRKIEADGFLSICLQHEIDHLDGILFYDRIDSTNPTFVLEDAVKY